MVKKISAQIMQCIGNYKYILLLSKLFFKHISFHIDVAMFAGGHCKTRIIGIETTEGCPVNPGSTLNKVCLKFE